MRIWLSNLLVLMLFIPGFPALRAAEKPRIDSPKPGDVLQGVVTITGYTNIFGFKIAEISFSYDNNAPAPTWFLIDQKIEPVNSGTLATWDTTTITDGVYRLQVKVYLEDGSTTEIVIGGLRVRNYTPVETSAPTPTALSIAAETAAPLTPSPAALPTATALPPNPAEVTSESVISSVIVGTLAAIGLLVLAGIFILLRSNPRARS